MEQKETGHENKTTTEQFREQKFCNMEAEKLRLKNMRKGEQQNMRTK